MRFHIPSAGRAALVAAAALILAGPIGLGVASAQDKATEATQPKQVTLTQKSLDGLIAAQKEIRDIEAKAPKDAKAPDPKLEAQINAAVTKKPWTN